MGKKYNVGMKKRFAIIFILLSGFFKISALGIGPQVEVTEGFISSDGLILSAGASCSMKLDKEPVVINISTYYDFMQKTIEQQVTCDYWIFRPKISNFCTLFLGAGTGIGVRFSKNDFYVSSIKRIVSGFSWTYYDGFMEPYIQFTIQHESLTDTEFSEKYDFKFPVSTGVRFYF